MVTTLNDENYNSFFETSSFNAVKKCLPLARMTHIPSSMVKMTIDFVETSSLTIVTRSYQTQFFKKYVGKFVYSGGNIKLTFGVRIVTNEE